MKLVFNFQSASAGKAQGIALHNARVKGHWESNKAREGKIGGIRPGDSWKNIELVPIKSFKEKDWIGSRKIIGGRQKQAKDSEFTCWVIQAGGMNDTLPLETNLEFLRKSHKWILNHFGKENIMSSHIHLDEATPQLQIIMSNIVEAEKGKIYLGTKRTFGYQGLTKTKVRLKAKMLHDKFYEDVAKQFKMEAPMKELGEKGRVKLAEWKQHKIKKRIEAQVSIYKKIGLAKPSQKIIKLVDIIDQLNPEVGKVVKASLVNDATKKIL